MTVNFFYTGARELLNLNKISSVNKCGMTLTALRFIKPTKILTSTNTDILYF